MNKFFAFIVLLLLCISVQAQSGFVILGGTASQGGASQVTYSAGLNAYSDFAPSAGYLVAEGVQHPYELLATCGYYYPIADVDGNAYPTLLLGSRCWTAANVRMSRYSDLAPISVAEDYNNDASLGGTFGKLYSWYSAVRVDENSSDTPTADAQGHVQGVCPAGWRVPDMEDMMSLLAEDAEALRSPNYWITGAGHSPAEGFNLLPAGYYSNANSHFAELYLTSKLWSSVNVSGAPTAYCATGLCFETELLDIQAGFHASIRCVRNEY